MDDIDRLLQPDRDALKRALEDALQQRRELVQKVERIDAAIRRARAALGDEPDAGTAPVPRTPVAPRLDGGAARMPLHEALATVLRANGNRPMAAPALADEINRQELYRRADGGPIEYGQVHARVHAYGHMFVRGAGGIRLRDEELETHDAATLAKFHEAMLEVYDAALREVGYAARRFLGMVNRYGGHSAARHLLAKTGTSEGFNRLAAKRLWQVTMEYQVLRPEFRELFTPNERAVAKNRLLETGLQPSQLPAGAD